jgi:alcohol dehydrogenase class IV
MRFEFATAARILFGAGVLAEVGAAACEMGKRAFLILGLSEEHVQPLFTSLEKHQVAWLTFSVKSEPTVELVRQAVDAARQAGCDFSIGCGGGSAMDTAKAVSALLANGGDPMDYLEVIGRGKTLVKPSAPCITIPTTAGTGAEVTRNAVLQATEARVKVSLRSATMLPRLAVVDPTLTYGLPGEVTASTGLDALTQLVEPYVSKKATPITDALCRDGIGLAARALARAYHHGSDQTARNDMSLASLYGGLALANAGLGGAHGFAGPIGGMYPAPHGAICARLLPYVIEANLKALRQRDPGSPVLARYDEVARLLTGDATAPAEASVRWLDELCADLHVHPLGDYGITAGDIPAIVEKSAAASSMKGNPILLTPGELAGILEKALYQ